MEGNLTIIEKLTSIEQLLSKQGLLQKEVLTLSETCDYLNVSASYLYKLTSSKQVPHYVPTGKKIYFKRCELDEWLLSNKQTSDLEIEKTASDYLTKKGRKYV
jgi:excisionase family DNA binding protein